MQHNSNRKREYPPMHTVEHILNQTMVRMFGCSRSYNSHIERKKSRCDYTVSSAPTGEQVQAIEDKVNSVIAQELPVTSKMITLDEAKELVDLSKLPDNVSDTIRVVSVGNYDTCACIGDHVENTAEIGRFRITTHNYHEGRWRVRFKIEDK